MTHLDAYATAAVHGEAGSCNSSQTAGQFVMSSSQCMICTPSLAPAVRSGTRLWKDGLLLSWCAGLHVLHAQEAMPWMSFATDGVAHQRCTVPNAESTAQLLSPDGLQQRAQEVLLRNFVLLPAQGHLIVSRSVSISQQLQYGVCMKPPANTDSSRGHSRRQVRE